MRLAAELKLESETGSRIKTPRPGIGIEIKYGTRVIIFDELLREIRLDIRIVQAKRFHRCGNLDINSIRVFKYLDLIVTRRNRIEPQQSVDSRLGSCRAGLMKAAAERAGGVARVNCAKNDLTMPSLTPKLNFDPVAGRSEPFAGNDAARRPLCTGTGRLLSAGQPVGFFVCEDPISPTDVKKERAVETNLIAIFYREKNAKFKSTAC
ncbi:hypothetical protein EVAR_92355_1 [Eumeta japonica]|uniref:Uncharacterized protein n=1 Tax=Eumeta variegata TaxID=151549 RepID=A0A4C1TM22_EUMVA|nr:hypothetical protein EVAR_92355_1 [Eumeta japonica]